MDKYILDDNGEPILDENGKKILNPAWLAANPNYVAAADEVNQGGGPAAGFEMTAEIQAWHDEQVSGLKKAQSKALQSNAKNRTRANDAEARVAELEAENQRLRESGGGGEDEAAIQARIDTEVKNRVKVMEGERDAARAELATAKADLSEYRYEGRIKQAALGVIHPEQSFAAMATLKTLITEGADGDITCHDTDGTIAMNNQGDPLSVEEFVKDVFPKRFGYLCQTDTGAPANGNNGAIKPPKSNNPFAPETRNRTVQATLIKNDPAKARQFMQQAGYEPSKINRMLA
jgi:hypothetical protein